MDTDRALSDEELDELDAFLMSDSLSDEAMDLSNLDGFFAAVALNPELILPSQWLPWVWDMESGEQTPAFENVEQAETISALLLRHYNSVQDMIGEGRFAPLMYSLQQEDGSEFYDAEGWSMGFMLGVSLFQDIWLPVLDEHPEWLAPMRLLGTEEGWEQLEQMHPGHADQRPAIRAAYEIIPEMVEAIFQHFLPQREAAAQARVTATLRRSGDKVGRNDPCPCGSGKKFKKCCGAGPTLH
jgi:uncharacterized protein